MPLPTVELPEAVDDAAVVNSGASTSTLFDGDTSVLGNDLDPNAGGQLVASLVGLDTAHGSLTFNLPSQASGTFTYANTGSDPATQDSFYYQACDSLYGACSLATVRITIVPSGQPLPTVLLPIAVDDAIQVASGGTATTLIGDTKTPNSVLDNDSDPNGGSLLASLLGSGPQHGDMTFNVTSPGDGTFTYTNNASDPATSDSFAYRACDSLYGVCAAATVSITITNSSVLNHLPTPQPDTIDVAHGGTANVLVGGATSVLANDTDPDSGETATLKAFLIGSGPQHGVLTLNVDGTFNYSNTASDSATSDSFMYEACDVHGACAAETVTIDIGSGSGSSPTVTCTLLKQVNVVRDVVSIDMTKLFVSPTGDTLSYSETGLPLSLLVNANTGLLTGTLATTDNVGSPYAAKLTATAHPANTSTSENVTFVVLSVADHIFRNGFDKPPQPCQ